jgi:hypothetical protein
VPLVGEFIVIEATPGIVERRSDVPVVSDVYCVVVNILDAYGNDAVPPFLLLLMNIASAIDILPSLLTSY